MYRKGTAILLSSLASEPPEKPDSEGKPESSAQINTITDHVSTSTNQVLNYGMQQTIDIIGGSRRAVYALDDGLSSGDGL